MSYLGGGLPGPRYEAVSTHTYTNGLLLISSCDFEIDEKYVRWLSFIRKFSLFHSKEYDQTICVICETL